MTVGACCDELWWRRLVTRRHLLKSGAGLAALGLAPPLGRPVAFAQEATPAASPVAGARVRVVHGQPIVNGSFISPLAEVFGEVEVGQRCYVAGNTVLYAAEGVRVSLGDENNVQDNAYVLAQRQDLVFSNMVSVGHQAVIENSTVGDFTFFGYRSRVRNAVIGEGAMIMHGTVVEGVTIPADTITPLGARITTQAQADALPRLAESDVEFKRVVQDVNLEFVTGYTGLFNERGRIALEGIGPSPVTTWNPTPIEPQLGEGVVMAEMVRIVGDVRLGDESSIGQRTSIRADDGTPIVVGRRARIESRVTFHAIRGTRVDVGENAHIGDGNVIHGPVIIGDNFVSEDDVVVYRATVEDNVVVRAGAIIVGDFTVREGTIVPDQAVVRTQEEADALPVR